MNRQPFFPNELVIAWFEKEKRALPWREEPTPYRVWVSEVMLQQTRVSVVKEYFERWMVRFPTIQSLGEAPLEEVIKMWEGLGYYSRARNLHAGAKECILHFNGLLPVNEAELASIKGIGPYTVAALLNFAFRKRKPLIDGNVLRVMSRFFAIKESIDLKTTRELIYQKMDLFLPQTKYWVVSEALMEIGALICVKNPKCGVCPLQKECLGYQQGIAATLPIRKARKEIIKLTRYVMILECNGKVALQKGEKGEIMADLYEFPYHEEPLELGKPIKELAKVKHHFTHFQATLYPSLFQVADPDPKWIWMDKDRLLELPFSSGHRRVLENYLENTTY